MLHMCACERGFISVSLSSHLLSHLQLSQADTKAGNRDTVKHCMFAYDDIGEIISPRLIPTYIDRCTTFKGRP